LKGSCEGCYHSFGDKPNPHEKACEICIRNPKYPTKKMPATEVVDGIKLNVPQDMYISKDRKTFEEKVFMQKLAAILAEIQKKKQKKETWPKVSPTPIWQRTPRGFEPWEIYWEYNQRRSGVR